MTSAFKQHIKTALADENLHAALEGNAAKRIQNRLAAFASLPDGPALRERAHAVRAEVIEHLDQYAEQLVSQVKAHGIQVHRAADAKQAVQAILDIAQEYSTGGSVTIAKSKTMVGEEIHLNEALEKAGVHPVETDLGEFIVQLRNEPPSHIITPAIHLRRQQVGQLFHDKLGVPYTEEIGEMTNAARRHLRQVFLQAQVGLSGVNFGVAETGTLVLMTNEGNGRMVTTIPRVHIALMGMERIVPSLDDLALLMTLLPRAGTGQKLTAYASLINGPRREGEMDGPRQRHLVLLDNGRSAIRNSPLREALYCIRCGACLNACPVFREIGGHAYVGKQGEYSIYPGPIGSVVAPALFGGDEFGQLARASSLCGACAEACPVNIDLPKLLLRVRAGAAYPLSPVSVSAEGIRERGKGGTSKSEQGRGERGVGGKPNAPVSLKLGVRFYTLAATHPRLFRLAQRLAALGGKLAAFRSAWIHLPAWTGWGASKDFPLPAGISFQARWNSRGAGSEPAPTRPGPAPTRPGPAPTRPGPAPTRPGPAPTRNGPAPKRPGPAPLPLESSQNEFIPEFSERFANELEALGGKFNACLESELAGRILALLAEKGMGSAMAWEASRLPGGLLDVLQAGGVRIVHQPDPSIRAGITGAIAGIADTGTLVIPGGAGRPLTASLLPEIHIAVLRRADICQNLAQALRMGEIRENSAVALVTGPSRTGDIEMTSTIGVHGPGEVHVFCI